MTKLCCVMSRISNKLHRLIIVKNAKLKQSQLSEHGGIYEIDDISPN